jgi:23S rRNA pseudouridine1911/1915/1917 synthase
MSNEDFMPEIEGEYNYNEEEERDDRFLGSEDELYEHHRFTVDRGQAVTRLDKFLADRLAKVSRSKIQNAIRSGAVLVDNQAVKPNFKIKPQQKISIVFPEMPNNGVNEPDYIPLNIIYEDNDVLVINKQPGLVCHPGVGNPRGTLVNGLMYYWGDKAPVFNEPDSEIRPGLVHRIDKDTSGLLVIAKNQYAMSHLARQFFYHTIERKYWALVWGEPKEKSGTINVNIGRSTSDPSVIVPYPEGNAGKYAVTHYKIIEPLYYVSLVECQLETGRTHQIRVHMKYLGHTLFMDEKYGGQYILKGTVFTKYKQFVYKTMEVLTRQALHAKSLGFEHPTTGKWMFFDSELPDDFKNGLQMWRDYVIERKALL